MPSVTGVVIDGSVTSRGLAREQRPILLSLKQRGDVFAVCHARSFQKTTINVRIHLSGGCLFHTHI